MIKRVSILVLVVALVAAIVPVVGRDRRGEASPVVAGRVHRSFQPRKGKIFVLVIGSDARSGNPDTRADALHVVGLNTRTMRGGILNFPRDSWVNIPGHGQGKINESLYLGGPPLVARTIESLTNIRLDYWVMTGFEGFRGIVRGLNGIKININRAVNDYAAGARIEAGETHLSTEQALGFARSRKVWAHGDIDRTTNQGRLLLAMLKNLRGDVNRNPASLFKWISVGRKHTRLNISPQETFRLGVLATQVNPQRVDSVTVPVSLGSVGAASVVFISPGAQGIYKRFREHASL